MKIKFTKTHSGPYGTFVKGRECELAPVMLRTVPSDCYEEVQPEKTEGETEQTQPEAAQTASGGSPKEEKPKTGRRGLGGLRPKGQNE